MGAEAGEKGQVGRPLHDVDRVDLDRPHPGEHPAQVAQVDPPFGARRRQALGGQGHPPGGGEGEAPHRPVNVGGRFCRKAAVASAKSPVRNRGSNWSSTRATWSS